MRENAGSHFHVQYICSLKRFLKNIFSSTRPLYADSTKWNARETCLNYFWGKLSQGQDCSIIDLSESSLAGEMNILRKAIVIVYRVHKCYMIKDLLQNKLFEPQTLLFRLLHFQVRSTDWFWNFSENVSGLLRQKCSQVVFN